MFSTVGGEPRAQLCLDQCCHPWTSAYQVIHIVVIIIIIITVDPHDHDHRHLHHANHHPTHQAGRFSEQGIFHLGQLGGGRGISTAVASKEQLWLGKGKLTVDLILCFYIL